MLVLLIALIVLAVIAAAIGLLSRDKEGEVVNAEPSCATCSGDDARCEQDCMLEAAVKEIEYYDDEHLDKYAGRQSDSYSDEEIEEFAEVMYTLQPKDVAGWNRSLILRNVNIPNCLKDELIALLEG